MKTKEDIFNLIKYTVNLSGEIDDYHVTISKGRFVRENLIGIFTIRKGNAFDNKRYKLAEQINNLLIGMKNYSGTLLKGVTIDNKNYIGTFYLSEHWDKVIGYLESELDDDGNIVN
jgi:hypothetical protein